MARKKTTITTPNKTPRATTTPTIKINKKQTPKPQYNTQPYRITFNLKNQQKHFLNPAVKTHNLVLSIPTKIYKVPTHNNLPSSIPLKPLLFMTPTHKIIIYNLLPQTHQHLQRQQIIQRYQLPNLLLPLLLHLSKVPLMIHHLQFLPLLLIKLSLYHIKQPLLKPVSPITQSLIIILFFMIIHLHLPNH